MNAYASEEFLEQKSNVLWSFRVVCLSHVTMMQCTFFQKTTTQYFPGSLWEYFFEMSACILEQLWTTVGSQLSGFIS